MRVVFGLICGASLAREMCVNFSGSDQQFKMNLADTNELGSSEKVSVWIQECTIGANGLGWNQILQFNLGSIVAEEEHLSVVGQVESADLVTARCDGVIAVRGGGQADVVNTFGEC